MTISGLLLFCALCLSSVAGYYSIVGLASIFASAFYAVVIMATVLEISKLVVASWLYQKWNVTPVALKAYLTASVLVLMFITSLGIFGFLSKAHVDMGLNNSELTLRVEQMKNQKVAIQTTVDRYRAQLEQLDKSINMQLQNNRVSAADTMRKQQAAERADIKAKLDAETERQAKLDEQQTNLRSQLQVVESKVGPIKYIAEFFAQGQEVDIDAAVRYMILMIVMVFDPLAVLMIIASNMSLGRRGAELKPTPVADAGPTVIQVAAPPGPDAVEMMRAFGESMAEALTRLQPPPAPPSPAPEPVSHEPRIGQMHWDEDSRQTLRWDGSQWVALPAPGPLEVHVDPASIDTAIVQQVVQQSMDAWLNSALSNDKGRKEDLERAVETAVEEVEEVEAETTADPVTVLDETKEHNAPR